MPTDLTWIGNDSGNEGDPKVAANWSPAQIPADGDSLYFDGRAANDLDTNLSWPARSPANVFIRQTFTYKIGTSTAFLILGAPTGRTVIGEHLGIGSPTGSQRIKLDYRNHSGGTSGDIYIENSASSGADASLPPIQLLADDSDIDLFLRKGKVGVAIGVGQTATLGNILLTYVASKSSDADIQVGPGLTLTNFKQAAGQGEIHCGGTLIEKTGGDLVILGTGTWTTLTNEGGNAYPQSSGTITTINDNGGLVDLTRSRDARSVTTINRRGSGRLAYDPAVVTVGTLNTNGPVVLAAA